MLKSVEDRKELMAFTPPNVLLGYETRSNRHNNKNWQYSNRLKSS